MYAGNHVRMCIVKKCCFLLQADSLFEIFCLNLQANNSIQAIMTLSTDKNTKLYYSIKEVAQLVGVSESTLRYWETEFPSIRPKIVSSTKVRQYAEKDVEQIKVIYNLLKVRGFKISAARKYMRENRLSVDKSSVVLETLTNVRDELKSLREHLNGLV